MALVTFFTNETTDATSPIFQIDDGGYRVLRASGTFGGATITLYADFGDNNFVPFADAPFTAPNVKGLEFLKTGMRLRATISSSSGSTSINFDML